MNKILTMKKLLLLSFNNGISCFKFRKVEAQEVKKLTFEEVIKLSEEQSPNALMAKHRFRASYWQYRTFVAQYRPSLTLTGTTPDYSNCIRQEYGIHTEQMGYIIRLTYTSEPGIASLSQNIGFTGGTISLEFRPYILRMILRTGFEKIYYCSAEYRFNSATFQI